MRKNEKRIYLLELIIIAILLIALLANRLIVSKIIIAIILLIYAIIVKKIISSSQNLSIYQKEVLKYMTLFAIGYVVLFYVLGIYTGFYKSVYQFNFYTILHQIIPIAVIIVSSEIIRKEFISNDSKLSIALVYLFGILVDLTIYININIFSSLDSFLEVFGTTFFASLVSNILFINICKRYGTMPNIVYRLITILYMYIIPITPDVYIYFRAFCRMLYPIIIYYLIDNSYGKKKEISLKRNNKNKIVIGVTTTILMVLLIMLISCKFKYGLIVVGSSSMEKSISKGDAVVFDTKVDINDIKEGQIIIFEKNDIKIIHRAIKIEEINNQVRIYTKGDNNVQEDSGFVTKNELKGKVNFKIYKIGLPTIWLNDLFKGIKGE